MKKLLFIIAIFAMTAMMACGSESTTDETTDQSSETDTTVNVNDSTATHVEDSSTTANVETTSSIQSSAK